ncbi:hypothetical protein D3C76_407110 [compost metagenome]
MLFIGGPWAGKVYAVKPYMRCFAVAEDCEGSVSFSEFGSAPPIEPRTVSYHMYDRATLLDWRGSPVEVMVSRETECVIRELMEGYARNKA